MTNLNAEYFITNFGNHLDSIRETINEDIKGEVCTYLHGKVLDALHNFDMILPEDAIPTHHTPSPPSSYSNSDDSPGEAEASEGVPAEQVNEPTSHPAEQVYEPTTSHSFHFEKFKNDTIRTLSALTSPQNRRVNNPNESLWSRYRVETLQTTAALCGINRRIYGHWFHQ